MCDGWRVGGEWGSHHTPPTYPPRAHLHTQHSWLILSPPPTYSAHLPPPCPTLDHSQISIDFRIVWFSYLNSPRNLKNNWFDGSVSFPSARLFRFHNLSDFEYFSEVRSLSCGISAEGNRERHTKSCSTFKWIIHRYLWAIHEWPKDICGLFKNNNWIPMVNHGQLIDFQWVSINSFDVCWSTFLHFFEITGTCFGHFLTDVGQYVDIVWWSLGVFGVTWGSSEGNQRLCLKGFRKTYISIYIYI